MMGTEKTLVNVNKGQDAYSVIGNYILNHITAIEDMIAVIQVNGVIMNELYMVDMDADGYFYWESDWWEGEENVALLDFFPVSDAERIKWIPCSERLPEENGQYLITVKYVHVDGYDDIYAEHGEWTDGKWDMFCFGHCGKVENIIAWMPLPEPYAERRTDEHDDIFE